MNPARTERISDVGEMHHAAVIPVFSTSELPDAPGCRLPFGLGFLVFCALLVLALAAGINWLALLEGGVPFQAPPQGQANAVPPISNRYFSSGSVQSIVTGDLTFNVDLSLDDVRSYVNDDLAWIAYGGNGPTTVLVSFHEPENSVAISDGQHTALGVDAQCTFNVSVTDALVSGHVSCAHAQALDNGAQVGTTAIELDFSAATVPGGDARGDQGGGDAPPTDGP